MALKEYRAKRDFRKTAEPAGKGRAKKARGRTAALSFVVQQHHATREHYDFRLELDGVLKSWAVPKGPSLDPNDRRLAVQVEDHPLDYAGFEGVIPEGEYGAGPVIVWDRGTWTPAPGTDPREGLRKGSLKFTLAGKKLRGGWALVRMKGDAGETRSNWLLIKERDRSARAADEYDLVAKRTKSVLSGKTIQQVGGKKKKARSRPRSGGGRKKTRARRTSAVKDDAKSTSARRVEMPSGAARSAFPDALRPQLATLVDDVPAGDHWIHEVKFDGYRVLAHLNSGEARLMTRGGLDWSDRFPEVHDAVVALGLTETILDGEVVAVGRKGVSDFQSLQSALKEGRTGELVYFVFDMPFCDGWDLRECALRDRVETLKRVLGGAPERSRIRVSEHITGHGVEVLRNACRLGLEGVVSKRLDSPYVGARTTSWLKTKCAHRQEFVIAGYTDPKGARSGFGSLLMGYYDDDSRLVYAGKVGAGFDEADLGAISRRLEAIEQDESPFADPPRLARAHWVTPRLVAEVSFTEWTRDGRLRHPVFLGLREDKEASAVKRETTRRKERGGKKGRGVRGARRAPVREADDGAVVEGVTITHPERVVYAPQGLTKLEIARYYDEVADWIMPHALNRPLSLVRCPQGSGKPCFFHKHVESERVEGLRPVPVEESDGTGFHAAITSARGLIYLVQMNTLEFHGWQSKADKIERPDRIVLDLDPGEGASWEQVAEAARRVRSILDQLDLVSFVMTTGGKGLHVIAPIVRRLDWDEAKAFARSIAVGLETVEPERYTANMSKAKRRGKVFVDYLRTQRGATSILPYSTRARAGATVAMPIEWDEIDDARPDEFNVSNAPDHLAKRKADPWKRFFKSARAIPAAALAA